MGSEETHSDVAISKERVQDFIQNNSDPVVTAGDVAARFKMSNQYANRKLSEFVDKNHIEVRKVGAATKVY
jgi:Fic family protein